MSERLGALVGCGDRAASVVEVGWRRFHPAMLPDSAYAPGMRFSDLRREVFRLHGEGGYAAALDLLEGHATAFPDREPILYFWRMCLRSLVGDTAAVLRLFDEALARGHWWGGGFLADSDLDAARADPGWEERAAESLRRQEAAAAGPRPDPTIFRASGEPEGLLVALHGWGDSPGEHGTPWRPAAAAGWHVAVPYGSIPETVDAWSWDPGLDHDRVPRWVDEIAARLPAPRLVLAGFSMGGGLACRLAFEGGVAADGVIAVAPTFRHFGMPWPASPALRRVPTFVVVGERDWACEEVAGYAPVLERAGWPVRVEQKPATYHEFPADFADLLVEALAWMGEAVERP